MPFEFRMLGPLEMRRDGLVVRLQPKQRVLLAVLLIEHGRVVSVDRLIEAMWPKRPPADAPHALQMHVSRLRGLLAGDVALRAQPPGYVLEVDAMSIDSVRFERLLGEVREVARVEPSRAAARVSDALALWQGDPLADFTFDQFAQEEIARLAELRLEAEEEWADAELALGHAAEVIGELESLVAAAPLRERRRAQLMLALYRAGRQADALQTFRDARAVLREELGLEPSRGLRDLERAILRHDPALDLGQPIERPATAARRSASVVTVQPELSLELDPEEHERQRRQAAELVARTAAHFEARQPEPFVLAFVQEDHEERAAAAAAAVRQQLRARVGVASGDAVVGEGVFGGPLVERARQRATDSAPPDVAARAARDGAPFVDREVELRSLREAPALLVLGPPGIGKSRLVEELAHEQQLVVGRCSSYGASALAPLQGIAAALGEPSTFEEIPAAEVPLAFRRLCESWAPLVVVFDDLQWADALVLETIEHLVAHAVPAVRVICLAREDLVEEHPLALASVERLELAPLPEEHAAELARALGAADATIVARAEGNPLFIEQLLAHADETTEALPSTLRSLLVARLDRLTPPERDALTRAAVIGREFDAELLGSISESESPRNALAGLVRRGLLELAPATAAFEERFRFRHALIHDATYDAIASADRARLHEAVADAMGARGAADDVVGFHLERAAQLWPRRDRHAQRLAEDAGVRLGQAAITAWKRGDARTATTLLESATTLLVADDPRRLELLCELGITVNTTGDAERARQILLEVQTGRDGRLRLRAELERAAVDSLADPAAAAQLLAVAERAIPVFEAVADDRSLARAWMLAGWIQGGANGRHEEWLAAADRALACYRRSGWPSATALGHIAAALYLGPTAVPAAIERCLQLLGTEVDDLSAEANLSAHLGGLYAMAGEPDSSSAYLARATSIFRELGRGPSLLHTCRPIEAAAARLRGDLESAADAYREACSALIATGGGFHLATQAAELAQTLCDLTRFDEAEEWASVAERHARETDRQGWTCTRIARARLLLHAGELEAAAADAAEAVRLADLTDELNLRAVARRARGLVLEAQGRVEEAQAEVARAVAEYERKGNVAAAEAVKHLDTAATSPGTAA
jgi:DNA-binding SARP family transcriptional activator